LEGGGRVHWQQDTEAERGGYMYYIYPYILLSQISYHINSYHIISYHINSYQSYHIMLYDDYPNSNTNTSLTCRTTTGISTSGHLASAYPPPPSWLTQQRQSTPIPYWKPMREIPLLWAILCSPSVRRGAVA
jgi:hypothetical protein